MVVGGGGGGWVLKVNLVISFGFGQAEQYIKITHIQRNKMAVIIFQQAAHNIRMQRKRFTCKADWQLKNSHTE